MEQQLAAAQDEGHPERLAVSCRFTWQVGLSSIFLLMKSSTWRMVASPDTRTNRRSRGYEQNHLCYNTGKAFASWCLRRPGWVDQCGVELLQKELLSR